MTSHLGKWAPVAASPPKSTSQRTAVSDTAGKPAATSFVRWPWLPASVLLPGSTHQLAAFPKQVRAHEFKYDGECVGWNSWSQLVVLQERSFVFCAIPNVVGAAWATLLKRVSGRTKWITKSSRKSYRSNRSRLPRFPCNKTKADAVFGSREPGWA
eukprot:3939096-Rhodomonas_salina.2